MRGAESALHELPNAVKVRKRRKGALLTLEGGPGRGALLSGFFHCVLPVYCKPQTLRLSGCHPLDSGSLA